MTCNRTILTVLALLSLAASVHAAEPTPAQLLNNRIDRFKQPVSAPTQQFLDAMYDYEVWTAPDTTGQTELVVWARFADTGEWSLVHRYEWMGTADHGMWEADMGVRVFTTWWSALQAAEKLQDEGEITDYEILERPVEPQWSYEQTFGTRAQAEEFADMFEEIAAQVGSPHLTKIVRVSTLQFTYQMR